MTRTTHNTSLVRRWEGGIKERASILHSWRWLASLCELGHLGLRQMSRTTGIGGSRVGRGALSIRIRRGMTIGSQKNGANVLYLWRPCWRGHIQYSSLSHYPFSPSSLISRARRRGKWKIKSETADIMTETQTSHRKKQRDDAGFLCFRRLQLVIIPPSIPHAPLAPFQCTFTPPQLCSLYVSCTFRHVFSPQSVTPSISALSNMKAQLPSPTLAGASSALRAAS